MATPLTSTSLHAPPRPDVVRRETIRATGLALRNEGIFFLAALGLVVLLVVIGTIRFAGDAGTNIGFEFGPGAALPIALVGLLLPFGVWRSEDPSRRAYHWSMPVVRESHTLTKVFAGWLWLMAAVAVYLAVVALLGIVAPLLAGGTVRVFGGPAWQWAVPFTAASVGYLLTSIAVLSSEHPWRWIGGIVAVNLVTLLFLEMFDLDRLSEALNAVRIGHYGLNAAVFGKVGRSQMFLSESSAERWLGATLIWGAIGMTGVVLASRRHRDG